MLLRHRSPDIDLTPATPSPGLEHLDQRSVAMLRWLNASRLDFVLVGPVARAIRGERATPADGADARGPVAIVPAPYLRNYERLAAALSAHDAALRTDRARPAEPAAEVKLTADKLARGRRWLLRVGGLELDVESSSVRAPGVHGPHEPAAPVGDGARYQELLYESSRVEVSAGITVEVAAPEDLELFSHLRRTGAAPEFRITRSREAAAGARSPAESAESADSALDG